MATQKKDEPKDQSNPFDQFDLETTTGEPAPPWARKGVVPLPPSTDPTANPFDQFDDVDDNTAPEPDRSLWGAVQEGAGNWTGSAVKYLGDALHGITHPWELLPLLQAAAEVNPSNIAQRGGSMNPETLAPLEAVGKDYSDHYGNPLTHEGQQKWLKTLATDPVRLTTDLLTPLSFAAGPTNAGIAALRLANPKVGGIVSKAATAAAVAADPLIAMEPLAKGAGHVVRHGVINNADPRTKLVLRSSEGRQDAVRNHLANFQEDVPDSKSTGAQALGKMDGVPTKLIGLERPAKHNLPTEFGEVTDVQNAARIAQIQRMGRSPNVTAEQIQRSGVDIDPSTASIDELVDALDAADSRNYAPVDAGRVTLDDGWDDIASRPVMQDILRQAELSAANANRPLMVLEDRPAHQVQSTILGPDGRPITTDVPEQNGIISGRNLSFIKKAFDDAISVNTKDYGAGSAKVRDIMNARQAYLDWLEHPTRLPQHRVAREDSAAWRRQILRRHAGAQFEETLTKKLEGEDTVNQRAGVYGNLFDNPDIGAIKNPKLAKIAGGYGNIRQWSDVLTPEDLRYAESVRDELARIARANEKGKLAADFSKELDRTPPNPNVPNFLNPILTGVNAMLKGFTGHVSERNAGIISNALLTPEGTLELLNKAIEKKAKVDRESRYFHEAGRVVKGINRRAPGVYNALAAEREDRERRNALAP